MSENIKVSSKIELLPHNQELYDKIVEQIEKGEKSIFYSQATGLGKSFIFMKLVEDYFQGKRIMYIVPKIAIWENLIRYEEFKTLDATIDMFTYQSFNTYDISLVDEYDVVFIDECHHMLSDIQGTNIMTYCLDMNDAGKLTFGFTATPYYQDKYVDEECFDVSCYGYDVYEAIDKGLLPKIKLALANINLDEVPYNLKVQYSITGTKKLLDKILEEHREIRRWLAYFSNSKELERRAHELSVLFPNYKILKTYIGYEYNELVLDEFNNYDGNVILLSVNRLLEGVHLKNVQGVLLYRNVTEFSTYLQMYGRLCDIKAKTTPLFLDVSNAILSLRGISETKSSRYIGERKRYMRKDLFDITAQDYWTVELADTMSPVLYHKSDEFINTVINLYESGNSIKQICDELRVTYKVVNNILKRYLPGYNGSTAYSQAELDLMKDGIEHGLSIEEITDIVNEYNKDNNTGIIRTVGGVNQALRKKLFIIRRHVNTTSLSEYELNVIKKYGPTLTLPELMELLPGRRAETIRTRMYRMNIKPRNVVSSIIDKIGEDTLRQLHHRYIKGESISALAKETDSSSTALINAWDNLGLVTKLTVIERLMLPENIAIIKSCWYNPDCYKKLKEEFPSVHPTTLSKVAKSIGFDNLRKPLSDNELKIIRDCILKHVSVVEMCNLLNELEENKERGIVRKADYMKTVRIKLRQKMLKEGYTEEQLSTVYTAEEDTIVLKYANGEIDLQEAVNIINDLQINKNRFIVRTPSSVSTHKKDLKKK